MPRPRDDIWDYFTVIGENQGKKTVTCIYCNQQYTNATTTRMKNHIMKCSKCPEDLRKRMRKDERLTILPSTSRSELCVPSTSSTPDLLASDNSSQFTSLLQSQNVSEERSLSIEPETDRQIGGIQKEIDEALCRAIYASGVPLSLLDSEYWKTLLNLMRPDYKIPSRYMISNPCLNAEYSKLMEDVNTRLQNANALGLVADSWTDVNGKAVINFIITTPKPIFFKCIYPETERETGEFIGKELIKVLEKVGSSKFVAIITDNAAAMKSAWRYITVRYPQISCVGCISHTLNLLLIDIAKIAKITETINTVIHVIKRIKRKHVLLATFEKIQKAKYNRIVTTLKLPGKTRWNGNVIMLKSYLANREALELLAIDHDLNIERDLKDTILHEPNWILIQDILKILEPISEKLSLSESDKCLLSDVPEIFKKLLDKLSQEVESNLVVDETEREYIISAIEKRRDFCIQPIHLAANALDPRYRGESLRPSDIPSTMNYISQAAVLLDLPIDEVMANVANFQTKNGYYGESEAIWAPVKLIEPRVWWQTFAPNQVIQRIATRILSVPPSSAASERNWSLFNITHSLRRNRLQKQRVEKLIFVRSNLRLFAESKRTPAMYNMSSDSEEEYEDVEFIDATEHARDTFDCDDGSMENDPLTV